MIQYIEEVIDTLMLKSGEPGISQEEKAQIQTGIENMQANLAKLKPVIDAHNAEYEALQKREAEMEKLIHEFKNSLMIERIKLDTWENKNK